MQNISENEWLRRCYPGLAHDTPERRALWKQDKAGRGHHYYGSPPPEGTSYALALHAELRARACAREKTCAEAIAGQLGWLWIHLLEFAGDIDPLAFERGEPRLGNHEAHADPYRYMAQELVQAAKSGTDWQVAQVALKIAVISASKVRQLEDRLAALEAKPT